MDREIPDWVKVGQEVALRQGGWGRTYNGRTDKIAKVHKNGNFVLESDARQQWRPWRDGASKTGDARWSRERCVPITPEVRAELDAENRLYAAKQVVQAEADRLDKLARGGGADEIVAAADAIQSRSAS